MRSHLSPLDATFLGIEEGDGGARVHIGWANVFDPAPGESPSLERLRDQARERLEETSMLRRRLSMPTVGRISLPVWLPDPDFDIGQMIRRASLPAPGGEEELTNWLAEHFSHRLDRSRPLWKVTLLEGLEGGRWALVFKVHQCLVDGFSTANLAAALLDLDPQPEEGATTLAQLVTLLGEERERAVLARLRGVVGEEIAGGIDAAIHPHDVPSILSRSREIAQRLVRERLTPAPPTSLNCPTETSRQLKAVEVSLENLKRIQQEPGGLENALALTATAGGLRRLFEQRDEHVDHVRAVVPLNLRRAAESLALDSEISSLFVELPIAELDPLLRYRQLAAAAPESLSAGVLGGEAIELGELTPSLVQSIVARLAFTPGLFNITVITIPSFPLTLYALGAPIRRVIPVAPLFSGQALGIAAAGYEDNVYFGLHADRNAMPDLPIVRTGIEETLHDLSRVAA